MTRSSQPVRAYISEFDNNFERTLRRKRKVPEPSPPSSSSESEFEEKEETEKDMEVDNRTIKELSASGLDNAAPLCIQYPAAARGKTEEFELKSSLLHHILKYHGLSMEDPNKHLKEFEVVCSSMTPVNVDGSILKMKAFPFSLLEKAKDWLYELAPGTVTSWESMKRAFLEKFFPTSRVILLRKRISGIQQEEGESFPTYYERFKSLVASCPHNQMKEELLLQYFYEGLLPIERQMLDASAGGALVDKTPTAAKTLISNRALNAQQYEGVGQRSNPRPHQVNEVSAITELQNQMANLTTLLSQVVEGPKVKNMAACGVCSMQGHLTDKCPQLIENGGWETLNAMGFGNQYQPRNDPFSNTYNPGWRDHPNFKWREPQQGQQQSGSRQQPPGFYQKPFAPTQPQAQPAQKSGTSSDNDQILNLLTSMAQSMQTRDKKVDELEKQVGQIAEFMGQFREASCLAQPFLQSKKEEEEKDVLETFRKVQVNIPLLDAIKQIPKYANCLKKLCTTRKRFREKEVVQVSENVSAIIQRKLPPKCKDPGSFTIPCVIGNTRFKSAMLDLGASINVMPYSVYASMNLGVLKNDGVIIQLADRSNAYPKGVVEDVLVQVNHLIFSADFYVLEMDESDHAPSLPILLGRPFMKTAQTKIDVAKGDVTMAFGGDMICFKIYESIETPNVVRSCCVIDTIEKIGTDHSAPKVASRTMQDEGIGVEHKDHMATALKMSNLAKGTKGKKVHVAATSSQHQGKAPSPNPIPIKIKRWFPTWVQVPKHIPDGGRIHMDCRMLNGPIKENYYPLPFIELEDENPLHVVGTHGA
ncbi:unnamed protein product [Malus baccata var. baccata]